ncbi:MAG: hypothetical protein V3U39_12360 [Acidimicrobiia bacterium]
MSSALSRSDREVWEVAGTGGMLKFEHPDYEYVGSPAYAFPSVILDITLWRMRHSFRLVDVTHSGSYGAQKMAMVARHWEAQLALVFNTRAEGAARNWAGFLENLLIGHQAAGHNVAAIFFLGDPVSYVTSSHVQRDSAKYYAPLGLAANIETVNDASGKDVVRLTASLQGNSKLQGWVGLGDLLTTRVF